MPRLDQARVEFESRHCGHMNVSDQAGGFVEAARREKSRRGVAPPGAKRTSAPNAAFSDWLAYLIDLRPGLG